MSESEKRKAKHKAQIAAWKASDIGKAAVATHRGTYNASEHGRKWKYLNRFASCNPTQAQWERYRDTTHCECCGVELGKGSSANGKTQDHNHETNKLRGVICNACNSAEGFCKTVERAYQVGCYMASNMTLKELIGGLP